jgi:hypothetical protein
MKRANTLWYSRVSQRRITMPKQKRQTTNKTKRSAKSTKTRQPRSPRANEKRSPRETSAMQANAVPESQVEVEDMPFAGKTILALEEQQPLVSTSAATWDYIPDPQVMDVLAETEHVETASGELAEELHNHHSKSPELSGGDLDADWERADQVGEETVGGSVPTPDQDRVDELGQAVGLVYQDEEALHTEDKLQKRDRQRWELNPASQDDEPH